MINILTRDDLDDKYIRISGDLNGNYRLKIKVHHKSTEEINTRIEICHRDSLNPSIFNKAMNKTVEDIKRHGKGCRMTNKSLTYFHRNKYNR